MTLPRGIHVAREIIVCFLCLPSSVARPAEGIVAAGGTAVIRGSPGRRMSLVATMLFGINFLLTADTKLGGLYRSRLSLHQASRNDTAFPGFNSCRHKAKSP